MIRNRFLLNESSTKKRGVALILVVIVVALLTTAGLSFALLMQQSHQASNQTIRRFESQNASQSANLVALHFAGLNEVQRRSLGGSRENADYFVDSFAAQSIDELSNLVSLGKNAGEESTVLEMEVDAAVASTLPSDFDLSLPGFVVFELERSDVSSLYSTNGDASIRFGMTDDSHKLDLARLLLWERQGADASSILQFACGLNPQQADYLLDWMDADQEPRTNGGEQAEYSQLGLRYGPANRLPMDYQELSLIPGLNLEKIYGAQWLMPQFESAEGSEVELNDLSRSLTTWSDAAENMTPSLSGKNQETSDAKLALIDSLTLPVNQRLVDSQGVALIELNQQDLSKLQSQLSQVCDVDLVKYIILGRQYGVQADVIQDAPKGTKIGTLNSIELEPTPANARIGSFAELIDSHVIIPQSEGSIIVNSPLLRSGSDPALIDKLSILSAKCFCVSKAEFSIGRIHFESRLARLIPDLSDAAAQWLDRRLQDQKLEGDLPSEDLSSSLVTENSLWTREFVQAYLSEELSASDFQTLLDNLTDHGNTFSAWTLGHSGDFLHPRLCRLVVNGSESGTRQLYCQEMYLSAEVVGLLMDRLSSNRSDSSGRPSLDDF